MLRRPWQRVALAMFAVGWGANQFVPMLVVYRDELGLGAQTRALLFGVYAAGLIPGLVLGGGASDRWGRRRVVVPLVALSPLATLVLVLGRDAVGGLVAGRLVAGVCSGVVFSAASAWVRDLSGEDDAGAGARRAAVALSLGFGTGPLVAGLVAEWAPHPLWVPYLPHLLLGVAATALLLPARDGAAVTPGARLLSVPRVCRERPFLLGVAPMAPWVFGAASIAFAVLPAQVGGGGGAVAIAGAVAGLTLATGVGVQGRARRLEEPSPGPRDLSSGSPRTGGPASRGRPLAAGSAGLLCVAAGALVGALAVAAGSRLLLPVAAVALGAGYGLCLVSGLRETERLSDPAEAGATVAVIYALTYLGFAAPYAIGVLDGALGREGALLLAAAVALLCVAPVRRAAVEARAGG